MGVVAAAVVVSVPEAEVSGPVVEEAAEAEVASAPELDEVDASVRSASTVGLVLVVVVDSASVDVPEAADVEGEGAAFVDVSPSPLSAAKDTAAVKLDLPSKPGKEISFHEAQVRPSDLSLTLMQPSHGSSFPPASPETQRLLPVLVIRRLLRQAP